MPLWLPPVTGRSASFRLRFRFVSCVRAGEAKLCGCVRGVIFHSLGLLGESFVSCVALRRAVFVRRSVGFVRFCSKIDGARSCFWCHKRGFYNYAAFFLIEANT